MEASGIGVAQVLVLASNRPPVISGLNVTNGKVTVNGQVQPNRQVVVEARDALLTGGWSGVATQNISWSTNLYVPATFGIPGGTNTAGFLRLGSSAP